MQTNFQLFFFSLCVFEEKSISFFSFFSTNELLTMTSKTLPIYRNGRKFYISAEEYHRIRSEERIQRRAAVLKSQNLPVSHRHYPVSTYNPVQRSQSNPYEYQYGILRKPHIPMNALLDIEQRRGGTRASRSPIRKSENVDDSSSVASSITKKIRSPNVRSSSSDKILDLQRSNPDNEIKRSLSTEMPQTKGKQASPPIRRPVPTSVSDYGIAPISTFSMTPNDQSHGQTNRSKMKKYFAGIKPSSLNSPSKSSVSASSGTGSFFETGVQGSEHVYTVLGSSNRRTGSMHSPSETLAHNDYHSYRDFADENAPSLLSLIQRRNTELIRSKRDEFSNGNEGVESNPIRDDLWTGSTNRSQSTDGLIEKKRVRFADMEGLQLESNRLKSPINPRLLNRRDYGKTNLDSRGQARPFHNTLYQTTTKTNASRLATDV